MSAQAQSIIMMVGIFAIMYFMLIRPQNKKDKADKEMRNNLMVGDEIITIGGIYGKVVRIKDDRIVIASGAEKTKLEISKSAVGSLVDPETAKAARAAKSEEEEKPSKFNTKNMKKLGQKEEPAKVEEAPAPAEEAAPEAAEAKAE